MGIHLAAWGICITLLVGGVAIFNPKIAGIVLMSLGGVWIINFYIAWFIYRRKHKDFTKEIVNLILPDKKK